MKYDFDEKITRTGTSSIKWEFVHEGNKLFQWDRAGEPPGKNPSQRPVLPLWVADMDFLCPRPVVDALVARAKHGIYGYTEKTDSYYESVAGWMKKRHRWAVDREWICSTPGIVPALNMLVRTYISEGDSVILQPPVYYPFFSAVKNNGGEIAASPLVYENGRYLMDFDDLERKAAAPRIKVAILCNPHNPVGRVWSKEELMRFGEICSRNNVLIISDEIHGDLVLKDHVFVPFAGISEDLAGNSIICTSPSKAFNTAGLQTSNVIISNDWLRARFKETLTANGIIGIPTFGAVALEAAYDNGEEWLEQVMDYVEGNLRFLRDFISRNIPRITVVPPEGTYLVWMDCRGLGLDNWELHGLFLDQAGVYLEDGYIFGPEGEGFQRVNIACRREVLAEALERIKDAVDSL